MTLANRPISELTLRIEPVLDWLSNDAWAEPDTEALVKSWVDQLVGAGLPLNRVNIVLAPLHPEVMGISIIWTGADGKIVTNVGRRETVVDGGWYDTSPYKLMGADGVAGIRRRLDRPDTPDDFGVLPELRASGATDYVILLGASDNGGSVFGSWTTSRPGGFEPEELLALSRAFYALSHIVEMHALRRTSVNLLDTYVGRRAGRRILGGQIIRGSSESIEAVIWLSDVRGFTALSDWLPRDELIQLLNEYFDFLVKPIQEAGGEILKFMGDGLLAVFPTAEFDGEAEASRRAVAAAEVAHAAVVAWNRERRTHNLAPVRHGIALHAGEVSFGNIGASSRLDFTVIGPAVNLVHRLERLCADLCQSLVLSERVARHLPGRAVPLGQHELRGLRERHGVFTLPGFDHGG